jgi:predicted O-methyltransferase YrrM
MADPLAAIYYVLYGWDKVAQLQIRRLTKNIETKVNADKYYEAISSESDLFISISKARVEAGYEELGGGYRVKYFSLYTMLRILKPEIVLETGVEVGGTTAFILKALEDNNKGTLYSIDCPDYELVHIRGKEVGFVVPEGLRKRWVLKIGKSKDLLPNLLDEINKVDVFLHDSEHSYENMMFEYATVWPYLTEGALLLSDDISWNSAFRDFSRKLKRKPIKFHPSNLGGMMK